MRISDHLFLKMAEAARAASKNAYCPYSNYRVGAAVLGKNGTIFSGCNVENASFGLTSCAERNAIFQAIAMGHHYIEAIVIYTPTQKPTMPCGACRQVINEFGANAEVFSVCDGPEILRKMVSDLLPEAFGPKNLA